MVNLSLFRKFLLRKVIISIIVTILFYVIFVAFSDFSQFSERISHFELVLTPLILLVVICSIFLHALRYHYFLKIVGIKLKFRKSLSVYLAGLSMELTPAKSGELIRSYILKENYDAPYIKTVPLVPLERITNLSGLLIIAIPISIIIAKFFWPIYLALVVLVILLIIIQKKQTLEFILNKISYFKKFNKEFDLIESYEFIKILMKTKNFLAASLMGTAIWLIESVAIFLLLESLGINIGFFDSLLIYTSSAFLGGISFIPSGIGVMDGSLVAMLSGYGISFTTAAAFVLLTRLHFTWFKIGLGFIFLKLSFPNTKI